MTKLSEKLEEVKDTIGKLQAEANQMGYSIDLESVLISLEGHIGSIQYFENQEQK